MVSYYDISYLILWLSWDDDTTLPKLSAQTLFLLLVSGYIQFSDWLKSCLNTGIRSCGTASSKYDPLPRASLVIKFRVDILLKYVDKNWNNKISNTCMWYLNCYVNEFLQESYFMEQNVMLQYVLSNLFLLRRHIQSVHENLHANLPRRWWSGLERSPRKRKVGCSNPCRNRPNSLREVVTVPQPNAWH